MPTTFIRGTSPSYHDLYSKSLLIDHSIKSPSLDTPDECELKDFFFGLYSFKSTHGDIFSDDSESLSSGSATEIDEDEIQSVFALDRDSYDFESQLPSSMVIAIQAMLDEPDIYETTTKVGENHKRLNPDAVPFVPPPQFADSIGTRTRLPSIIRARVPAPSSPLFPLLPPPSRKSRKAIPTWISILHSASTAIPVDSSILTERATELAHSRFWHSAALAELAQHLCWEAANADVVPEAMAPFAWEVYQAVHVAFDEDTANSFVWHLRESLIGTFKGCWCATESSKAISYSFTPSEEYVTSATRLAAFIGDLFTFDLIRVQHIKMCLNILVHELTSLEHITAISVLIDHAGERFWCYAGGRCSTDTTSSTMVESSRQMIDLFLSNFLPKTAMLQNGSSVLAKTVEAGSGDKEKKVQEILDIVARWC
ncbi:hypothetical protein J3R30DRAFT_3460160 [Lentinula aciculospora]|uniref:Uncharacterized protein n=1 Tax=Lentinula aciculospora TaxID=153920 RepID=A0A9W9AH53_9AGAR|nr:hypothetical protein J3R30DRAFT_3460160 [Lentinula aciculospora]